MNHVLKHSEVEEAAYEPARPQHQSADVVKGLLYNIPQRPEDVSNLKGRRQGPAKKATDAPFAQSENMVEADYPSSFHLQKHNKQVNDKVGHGQFDPEVYKANAMANIHNRTQSRARNFVGSGNILSYNKLVAKERDTGNHWNRSWVDFLVWHLGTSNGGRLLLLKQLLHPMHSNRSFA